MQDRSFAGLVQEDCDSDERWRYGRRRLVRCEHAPWCSCPECGPNEEETESNEQDERSV